MSKVQIKKKLDCNEFVVLGSDGKLVLGQIVFNKTWKKFAFWPINDSYFDGHCLLTIGTFMSEMDKREDKKTPGGAT